MSGRFMEHLYPLKIVTGTEMSAIDQKAICERHIPGLHLMEQAGEGVAKALFESCTSCQLEKTIIFCGKGNNGGDGFVIARHLVQVGYSPTVILVGRGDDLRGDAKANYLRLKESGVPVREWTCEDHLSEWKEVASSYSVWIDALLGTGSCGAPRGLIADAITLINQYAPDKKVISVDISSGVDANTGAVEGVAVQSDDVYTMGLPKVGHVLPPGLDYYKHLHILDIGFPIDLLLDASSEAGLGTATQVRKWLPARSKSAHKGSEGHVLIIAGSRGMTGAALLCSKAAVKMGSGLVTAVCPESLLPVYANGVWEMLTVPVAETRNGSIAEEAYPEIFSGEKNYAVVVIGPGLGRNSSTEKLVQRVVRECEKPIVIDGDALSAVSLANLKERSFPWIATPHPGEMARLFGTTSKEIQAKRWRYARSFADTPHGVVVLKGANTVVARQGSPLYVNPTGNPGMASGGMGDVLAGMIGSLVAKGVTPCHAAKACVFLHGLAADIAIEQQKSETICASELIAHLQAAISFVRNAGCE